MTLRDDAINLHRMLKGKIEIRSRVSLDNAAEERGTLGLIYTPGVAYVALEISSHKKLAYDYTSKWNNVAIICDGTRVLGLGNIGPEGALPIMEGKSVLFKALGDINAIPLCIDTQDKEEIIRFVKLIQPNFGAINIEDIESPKVLEIVERLTKEVSIPVFHDDQHGTAIITLAALINALRLVNKELDKVRVVISGSGSAGYGIFKILQTAGCKDIIVTDTRGAIFDGRVDIDNQNPYKKDISINTNSRKLNGTLMEVIRKSDIFIGVSGKADILNKQMIKSMNKDAIVFALSNPDPEIIPNRAFEYGARIVATGRSDFPNQINNAVVFPSIFRALLDLRANNLSENMLVSVAHAIASIVEDVHLRNDYIIPKVDDPRILPIVTKTIKKVLGRHIINKERSKTDTRK
ncbi:MAG TPA: NADP-dependent malic enzyme [Nitrososphaeraceae archaeon]|nr:NADP-dependent malic enzyme [Nitrososphaeraceae archaeon]